MIKLVVVTFVILINTSLFSFENHEFYTKYRTYDNGSNTIFIYEKYSNNILIAIDSLPFHVSFSEYARMYKLDISFDENGNPFALSSDGTIGAYRYGEKSDKLSTFQRFNFINNEDNLLKADKWFHENSTEIITEMFSVID